MRPKNTAFNGIVFRSKLEAQWAVFFNMSGVEYDYEPRIFKFGDNDYYLPDFYLPDQKLWVEIKGPEPSDKEIQKCLLLKNETGRPTFIFSGFPQIMRFSDGMRPCNFALYVSTSFGIHMVDDLLMALCAITKLDSYKIISAIKGAINYFKSPRMLRDIIMAMAVTSDENKNGPFSHSRRYPT